MALRTIIDASAGGSIIELTPTEAFTLFKKVADNDTWASSGRLLPVQPTGNVKGILQVEKKNILEGKIRDGNGYKPIGYCPTTPIPTR
jgi:hypothetical protein